jgi:hypothetical protein
MKQLLMRTFRESKVLLLHRGMRAQIHTSRCSYRRPSAAMSDAILSAELLSSWRRALPETRSWSFNWITCLNWSAVAHNYVMDYLIHSFYVFKTFRSVNIETYVLDRWCGRIEGSNTAHYFCAVMCRYGTCYGRSPTWKFLPYTQQTERETST